MMSNNIQQEFKRKNPHITIPDELYNIKDLAVRKIYMQTPS